MIPTYDPGLELDENMACPLRAAVAAEPTITESRLEPYRKRYKGYTKDDLLRVLLLKDDMLFILECETRLKKED